MVMQPSTGKNKGNKIVDICKVQQSIGTAAVENLLSIHTISGCDTTSALYGHGKVSIFKQLTTSSSAREHLHIMNNILVSHTDVTTAGNKLLVLIYGGKLTDNLDSLRHCSYMRMCATSSSKPVPDRLPPTEHSADFHGLRTHIEVIRWLQLSTAAMKAEEWGWALNDGKYEPIPMQQEPGRLNFRSSYGVHVSAQRINVLQRLAVAERLACCVYLPVGNVTGRSTWTCSHWSQTMTKNST